MKYHFLLFTTLFISFHVVLGQKNSPPSEETPLSDYTGDYGTRDSTIFSIILRDDHLFFSTGHYGKIGLISLPDHRFQLQNVKPEAFVDFSKDSFGKIAGAILYQKGKFTWIKINENGEDSLSKKTEDRFSGLTGKYRQDIDMYNVIHISEENGYLKNGPHVLSLVAGNKFVIKDSSLKDTYEFIKDKEGNVQKIIVNTEGPRHFEKRQQGGNGLASGQEHISNRQNGFTRADSLRGMLTPIRTCYDVLFYDLNVTVEPETKSIHGNAGIRFKTVAPFDSMQVDLYANMKIEKILFRNRELSYTREFNAVYVHFPVILTMGDVEEINIIYSGHPQLPDPSVLAGGFFWVQNREGKPWIQSVCQGSGASLWWPCKDHLSDKPDSMKISITVPHGLTDISNGRLQKKTELPGNLTRFDWYVSYPINNYDVAINIGDYSHFSDQYISQQDTLTLDYYCMPYNLEIGRQVFKNVKPMLGLYEKDFGKYPFIRDGFTLMESFYPMEHQSAVSIGYFNNPFNSDRYDSMELTRVMWHESAHEWWGNSVTCKDMADLWIHEAFATYAEVLAYEAFSGREAALKYLRNQHPDNKEPIIGIYNVNHFHLGDMYSKGVLMLHTLRNIMDDDSLWFSILKGIQERFRYQAVTTEDIVGYFNQATKKDYTHFFNQYLRYPAIPELALIIKKEGSALSVQYKWNADISGFDMPVKITTGKNSFAFIFPATNWQTISLPNMKPNDFKVNKDDFHINVKVQ